MSLPLKDHFDGRLDEAIREYEAACADGARPPARAFASRHPDLEPYLLRELVIREFDWLWREGQDAPAEVQLNRYPEWREDEDVALCLLHIELNRMRAVPDEAKLCERFPGLREGIRLLLA